MAKGQIPPGLAKYLASKRTTKPAQAVVPPPQAATAPSIHHMMGMHKMGAKAGGMIQPGAAPGNMMSSGGVNGLSPQ